MTGTDAMEDLNSQRTRRRGRHPRRLWLSVLSWFLILTGLSLIATPLWQRAYSELVQAQLRAAMEQELAADAGDGEGGATVGSAAAGTVGRGLVGLADRVFDTLDPVFSRVQDEPALAAPEGIPGLPTRATVAGASRIIIEKAEVDAVVVD